MIAQVVGPALLYLPGTQKFRVVLRMGVFAVSLYGLFLAVKRPKSARNHPAWSLLMAATLYMVLMLFHPTTNTYLAGAAQIGMHLAILAPLFWAPPYFAGDPRRLARVLTIFWVLNGASTVVGILQVYDPDRWLPSEFSSVATSSKHGLTMYEFRTDDGKTRIRPPGLGDMPGAASAAGMFVASMGLAYLGLPVSRFRKFLGIAMAVAGLLVIFLTQVRSALLVTLGSVLVYLMTLVGQKRIGTALILMASIVGCGLGALQYASSFGGRSTIKRFATLLEDDPMSVYEDARMSSMNYTLNTLIMDHPFGAGLGRWGMMRNYFGNESSADSPVLWAEIQFAAWVVDGGIVVTGLYSVALLVTIYRVLRASFGRADQETSQWAGLIVMLSAGPIALLFSYCPFYSQMGMQFWLLIGAFEGVMQGRRAANVGLMVRDPRSHPAAWAPEADSRPRNTPTRNGPVFGNT